MKHKKGVRYTTDQKRMVLAYVKNHRYGGITEAVREFGVSAPSIYLWMDKEKSGNKRKKKIKVKPNSKLDGRRARRIQNAQVTIRRFKMGATVLQKILGAIT